MDTEEIIKNAQYRKNLSISFFNATNNATQIVELLYKEHPQDNTEVIKKDILEWRDWLLEEHKNYYAKNIANIGGNFNKDETIKKLKTAKKDRMQRKLSSNEKEEQKKSLISKISHAQEKKLGITYKQVEKYAKKLEQMISQYGIAAYTLEKGRLTGT